VQLEQVDGFWVEGNSPFGILSLAFVTSDLALPEQFIAFQQGNFSPEIG
jgi:hypothetical protein